MRSTLQHLRVRRESYGKSSCQRVILLFGTVICAALGGSGQYSDNNRRLRIGNFTGSDLEVCGNQILRTSGQQVMVEENDGKSIAGA